MTLAKYLIAVVLWLVRAVSRDTKIIRLLVCELGNLDTKMIEMQSCDFLVELAEERKIIQCWK